MNFVTGKSSTLHFDTSRRGLRCQQDATIHWAALAPTPPTPAGTNRHATPPFVHHRIMHPTVTWRNDPATVRFVSANDSWPSRKKGLQQWFTRRLTHGSAQRTAWSDNGRGFVGLQRGTRKLKLVLLCSGPFSSKPRDSIPGFFCNKIGGIMDGTGWPPSLQKHSSFCKLTLGTSNRRFGDEHSVASARLSSTWFPTSCHSVKLCKTLLQLSETYMLHQLNDNVSCAEFL